MLLLIFTKHLIIHTIKCLITPLGLCSLIAELLSINIQVSFLAANLKINYGELYWNRRCLTTSRLKQK